MLEERGKAIDALAEGEVNDREDGVEKALAELEAKSADVAKAAEAARAEINGKKQPSDK